MEIAHQLDPLFKQRGYVQPPYRITCGWPCKNGLGRVSRTLGECHSLKSSKTGVGEIFISPCLDDPLKVAGVVSHELAHNAVGVAAGHKGKFVTCCKHLGITKGKPIHAMPGEKLSQTLQGFIDKIGAYPHSALEPVKKLVKASGQIKLICTCGCNFRISQKWLDESGIPLCGCGASMEIE